MGEQLESLNLKELQQLEQQLESSLKHIRTRKVKLSYLSQVLMLNQLYLQATVRNHIRCLNF